MLFQFMLWSTIDLLKGENCKLQETEINVEETLEKNKPVELFKYLFVSFLSLKKTITSTFNRLM